MAVETLTTPFNGNFDAVTKPTDRFAPYPPNIRGPRWRYEMPGWAFHNGKSGEENTYESWYLENMDTTRDNANRNYALSMGKVVVPPVLVGDDPTVFDSLTEITHNRMYVPEKVKALKFDIKVTQESDDDAIVAYMGLDGGWQRLGEYELKETTSDFEPVRFDVPPNFRKQTSQLKFELRDGDGNSLDAELLLDNIFFEEEVSA